MQLDRIRIRLRQRSGWEALDLGRVMVHAWAGPTYRAWAATYVPCALLLGWLSTDWGALVLWWLMPFFDRVLLHVYGRSLFGRPTSVRDVWRALPDLIRNTGLLAALTIHRLSPIRSFTLPVRQLEEQRGRAARLRTRVLAPGARAHAMWLTGVCWTLTYVLVVSQALLVELLAPVGVLDAFDFDLWVFGELGPWANLALVVFVVVADSVIEPLYVASGFALYLNRRADLEAWDLDLAFRALAARQRHLPRRPGPGLAAALLVGMFGLASPSLVAADQPPSPAAAIHEVLADPVFGEYDQRIEWRPRTSSNSSQRPAWLTLFRRLLEFMARFTRILVWVAGAALIGLVVSWLLALRIGSTDRRSRAPVPDHLFGLNVRLDSLPDDVVGTARALVQEGRVTEALSLLYRGALVSSIHTRGVEFRAGDTEGDCLRRAAGALAEPALALLGAIVAAWQAAAYAGQPPHERLVLSLADRWGEHFRLRETHR